MFHEKASKIYLILKNIGLLFMEKNQQFIYKYAPLILIIFPLIVITVYYFLNSQQEQGILAIIIAFSSFAIGGLIGFLFGIPRYFEDQKSYNSNSESSESSQNSSNQINYRSNTNLEQISDWLTKILVGVGLTQLPALHQNIQNIVKYLVENLASGQSIILGIMTYYTVMGFLAGYLGTFLYLKKEFERAEQDINKLINDQISNQAEKDGEALAIVYSYLAGTISGFSREQVQEKLNSTLNSASLPARINIFYEAHELRKNNREENQERMERSIPIFESLIKTIKNKNKEPLDRYYGELGYAFKDKREPEWKRAKEYLTEAIKLRNDNNEENLWYEFNRAICNISLITDYPSEAKISEILEDLQKSANSSERMKNIINENQIIREWFNKYRENPFLKKWIDDNQWYELEESKHC